MCEEKLKVNYVSIITFASDAAQYLSLNIFVIF